MTPPASPRRIPSFSELDPRALATGRYRHDRRAASASRGGAPVPLTTESLRTHRMRWEAQRKLVGEVRSAPVTPITAKPMPPAPDATARGRCALAPTALANGAACTQPLVSRWSDSSASGSSRRASATGAPISAQNAPQEGAPRGLSVGMSRWSDSSQESNVASEASDGRAPCLPQLHLPSVFDDFSGYLDIDRDAPASPQEPLTPHARASPHSANVPLTPRTPMPSDVRGQRNGASRKL